MSPLPYFVVFLTCLVVVAHQIFPAREHLALLTIVGLSGSMLALIPLFFGWWKGKGRRVIHGFLIFYTWLLCLWMLASLGLYQERGRALTRSRYPNSNFVFKTRLPGNLPSTCCSRPRRCYIRSAIWRFWRAFFTC